MSIELALSRPKAGVTHDALQAAALAVASTLDLLPGLLRRAVLHDGSGQWADLIHWDRLDNAQQAMARVGGRPEVQRLFSLLDDANIEMLHMTSVLGAPSVQSGVTELALFRAIVDVDAMREAAASTWDVLAAVPGYRGRELLRDEAGQWADVVQWETLEHALAAMPVMETHPAMTAFIRALDPSSIRMFHLTPVHVYTASSVAV